MVMRSLAWMYVPSFLAFLGLGFWAYEQHYKTRSALEEILQLRGEISDLHEAITLRRAEWAYLNRPDRLRNLVDLNYDLLGLQVFMPEQFGDVSVIAYPAGAPQDGAESAFAVLDLGSQRAQP